MSKRDVNHSAKFVIFLNNLKVSILHSNPIYSEKRFILA
jgi:hypothetical protein